jgi:hypothetical protein
MKVGDLVKRKRRGWLGIVLSVEWRNNSVTLAWVDDGTIDDCTASLMEVISESR